MNKVKSWIILGISVLLIAFMCVTSVVGLGAGKNGFAKDITLGLDLRGGASVTYEVQEESFTATDMSDTIYKLQLRVAEYSTDASVYQEGERRITVEIPGIFDTQKVIDELGRPGSLKFVTYDNPDDPSEETVWVTGSDVASAQAGSRADQKTGNNEYIVALTFNESGIANFSEATSTHIGDVIYIIYDDAVVSYPTVQSAITDGSCEINGMGSWEAAENLASTIRIGSLSLTLKEVSSKVVSAKLGDNAISTSLIAGLIGLALIIIFMIIYYRVPGIAAALSMVFYTAMTLLLLNAFELTLTISGIAGIILSIGMAVDGNVIINERIKEELKLGRSVEQAVKYGYKKSLSAILDGNITTLIVAIVLLIFGSGSVKGFGMTLAIGIVLSVVTSLFVSRLFVICLMGIGLNKAKNFFTLKDKKEKKVFDFVGKKAIWLIVALACIIAGVVGVIANAAAGKGALNESIEFKGGVSTTVDFATDYSIDEFNNTIKPEIASVIGNNDIEGQKVTGTTQYVIKTQDLDVDTREELINVLVDKFDADRESFETTFISSSVSAELQRDAFISLAIATVCMLLYIWVRFRKFKVAISSVICLLHDVAIVVSFFALFRLSVGNSFIACILTIVGYSINATIVIFDRIRENLSAPEYSGDLKAIINASISQTMTRSIFTSATTFVTVLFLYILGVEAMKAFALPLAIGIIAGAFSSVLISGNLVYIFTKKEDRLPKAAIKSAKKTK